ncbi:hypothetical protein B0F90DRAFT_1807500 [Multifurca ochricompacta]|uniref:N-acetyltransferase domain-containing protein n=1 Tax=Multifurca ochricompacta TaxID=376703 RepID=A0AAD4MDZ9_9AGAM|nr:hypothetical protein B0F90DRAFT_1807500 [Multifurca ochricompacta]
MIPENRARATYAEIIQNAWPYPCSLICKTLVVVYHNSPADFLSATFPTLRRHEESANIVFAHALKLLGSEAALTGCHFTNESDVSTWSNTNANGNEPFWLTVWSSISPFIPPTLDIVLSCVSSTLGDYPIFLWTPKNPTSTSPSWLHSRIEPLADHLLHIVPPRRVFSVFGATWLVKPFTRHWSDLVQCPIEPEPFYAACYTYCNLETFKESNDSLTRGDGIRRANMEDLGAVAQLCKEFADDSVYFPLEIDAATIEGRELISKGLIWIYESDGEVTSICAVTRSTQNVSAITKVYTTPKWRRRGFAEHLVRNVTKRLLIDCGKRSVTLYVGHSNNAQRVYDRVGFVGLCGKEKINGVEDSLELGLVTGFPRGHW